MSQVKIYVKDFCPYCKSAKNLFKNKGIAFEEIDLSDEPQKFAELKAMTGLMTVPQIFVNDKLIGGYTEAAALEQSGELDRLLNS